MARQARIVIPGQAMHVVQRGNNRQATFYADEDYRRYLDILFEYAEQHGCAIHTYVLMTNHIHLLLTPETEKSVSNMMQAIGRKYVRYVNGVYQRTGTLWEGRYKSAIIDSDHYLLTCSRYIELNPVRAGMVNGPDEYKWSSYFVNALGKDDKGTITPHVLYEELGSTKQQRQRRYRALFENAVDKDDLMLIRNNTQQCTVIGKNRFQDEIEMMLTRKIMKCTHGGDRKSIDFEKKPQSF